MAASSEVHTRCHAATEFGPPRDLPISVQFEFQVSALSATVPQQAANASVRFDPERALRLALINGR